MVCNAVLLYVLVFTDGHRENREKWTDKADAIHLVATLHSPEFYKAYPELKAVEGIELKVNLPPFDCNTGPRDESR
jgi:hypothetical protein